MNDLFRHSPYLGLAALRDSGTGFDGGFEQACAEAERVLGCVPSGRLREFVLLSSAAMLLQRARADDGMPLFLVKGGLVCQMLLGNNARPTHDLDTVLLVDAEEFVDRMESYLAEPWGRLSARIDGTLIHPGFTVVYNLFHLELTLMVDGEDAAKIRFEGSYAEPRFMLGVHAYPAPAIDAVGLPSGEALLGVTPARVLTDKLLNLTEPHVPQDDPRYRDYKRPHRTAKHLADGILLSRLSSEGGACTDSQVRDLLEARVNYENRLRRSLSFPPFDRPLRSLPHEGWPIEYLVSALQAGLDLGYDDALLEIDSFFDRIGI